MYEFGAFRLDDRQQLLFCDGNVVPLTPKAFATLAALVRRHGDLVTKDELIAEVWRDTFVTDSGLARNISVIRKALGTDAEDQKYIETIPKRGYRFVAPVRIAADASDVRVADVSVPSGNVTMPPRRSPSLAHVAIGIGVVAVVVAAVFLFRGSDTTTASTVRSIAVLPFLVSTESPSLDAGVMSAGMADALVTRLNAATALEVRPSRATMDYRQPDRDARAIGRALKAEAIVDGTIAFDADRLRVEARVISVADGSVIWSASYHEVAGDLFVLHERIAADVARELGSALRAGRTPSRQPRDPSAYQSYLTGRYHWNKRSPAAIALAATSFGEALDSDPTYAPAYAGLADSYALLGVYGGAKAADAFERARAAATRALELDESLAEAHASLGFTRFAFDWDWAGADRAYQRAIALNPNYATAHHWHAILLMVLGRTDESLAAIRRAQRLDPLSLSIASDVAELLLLARRPDDAIQHVRDTVLLHPGDTRVVRHLGAAYLDMGRGRDAVEHFDARTSSDDITLLGRVRARVLAGDRSRAEALMAEFDARAAKEGRAVDGLQHAVACVTLGRTEAAFADLERAYRDRSISLTWLKVLPALDPLRSDPRFGDLSRRLRLDGPP